MIQGGNLGTESTWRQPWPHVGLLLLLSVLVCFLAAFSEAKLVFSSEIVLSDEADGAIDVLAADIDGDGFFDVVSASIIDGEISWFRNSGDSISPFPFGGTLISTVGGVRTIFAIDLDNDGDTDVLAASEYDDTIGWFRNNGTGFPGGRIVISTADGAYSVYASDIDNDGDPDVLAASLADNVVAWFRNNGSGGFPHGKMIITNSTRRPDCVFSVDLNNDGSSDVLVASYEDNTVSWFRNNGTGGFGMRLIITNTTLGVESTTAIDLDNDGDADVLSASSTDDTLAWFRNDGSGNFSGKIVISNRAVTVVTVYAYDLDNDLDYDVLTSTVYDGRISYYRNNGSAGFPEGEIVISNSVYNARSVFAADLNGDGLADVLSASFTRDKVAWFRNIPHGQALFTTVPSWEAVYSVGFSHSILVLPRDAANRTVAQCEVSAKLSGPALATFLGQLANGVTSSDGYTVAFTLPSLGSYQLALFVDSESVNVHIQFEGSPFSCGPGERVFPSLACSPCEIGTYQGGFSFINATCGLCPANTTSREGARVLSNCTCLVDHYTLFGAGSMCAECPVGAKCAGDLTNPLPLAGWASDRAKDKFARCPRPSSCLPDGRGCALGYSGYMCKDCQPHYYAARELGECAPCLPRSSSAALVVMLFIILISAGVLAFIAMCISSKRAITSLPSIVTLRLRSVPPSLSIALINFQILGVFANAELAWPKSAERALMLFNVFSLDLSILANECALSSFAVKYILALFLPVIFFVIVIVCLAVFSGVYKTAKGKSAELSLAYVLQSILFMIGPLAYLPLARSTLVLFDCTMLADGHYYLDANMSVLCFGDSWWRIFPFGLFGFLCYVLGIPAVLGTLLLVNREGLFANGFVIRKYGSIYKLFRRNFFFWPLVLTAKKLAIAVISLFFSRFQSILIALLGAVILGTAILQSKLQPYYFSSYEALEIRAACALSVILLCGMVFYAAELSPNDGRTVFFLIVMFTALIVLLLLVAYHVATDVRDIIAERRAKANGSPLPDPFRDSFEALVQRHAIDLRDPSMAAAVNAMLERTPDISTSDDLKGLERRATICETDAVELNAF